MKNDTVWQTTYTTNAYLEGVRGAIPLAHEQIDVMLRLIRAARGEEGVTAVLDLGCGDGILGQAVLDQHPNASGLFIDFSAPMLEAAKKRLADYKRVSFLQLDYGVLGWEEEIKRLRDWETRSVQSANLSISQSPFDVIVSGFSIHHQPDERKREVYQEIFELLRPGGIFLNLEHVQSATPWIEAQHDELFIDHMHVYQQEQGGTLTRTAVSTDYHARPDKIANILAPVETQCNWLREIGFAHVDTYLKIFELALFGGLKPKQHDEI